MAANNVATDLLAALLEKADTQKGLADRALAQLDERQLRARLGPDTNSIAVIIKHLAGNHISRWTDFLTADGEKADRHRDQEFVDDFATREEMLACWERGWRCFRDAIIALTPDDLLHEIVIRGHRLGVIAALVRAIEHNGYHVGQIVQLARHWAGDQWTTLTIAPQASAEYNRQTWGDASPAPVQG